MLTIAEQWIEQGRAEGLKQGLDRGLEQGREEGREAALTILRHFLKHRFGITIDQFDDDLQTLNLAAITQLSDVAFEAATLAEFEEALARLKPETNGEGAE
jgi:flagellar biosynthesis/type III secretory pathway protein FliH